MFRGNERVSKPSYLFRICWVIVTIDTVWTTECKLDEFKEYSKAGPICCKRCDNVRPDNPCPDQQSLPEQCRCNEGYVCKTNRCLLCTKKIQCGKNQLFTRTGTDGYKYTCVDCPEGTNLEIKNMTCIPRPTPTLSLTTRDMQTTSINHRTLPLEENNGRYGSVQGQWPIILFAFVVLVVLSIIIHFLIWKVKQTRHQHLAETHPPSHIIVNQKDDGDSWSCQYPEEEHGESTIEKPSIC
ncbi:uncharacterized protein LOC134577625 [Pelobates fuscus]|uniref:uncharacterized protein LOC134577625 n=1 Tax=Pelobates fuscus TaxID=191477 RepID=UPI002FE4B62A